MHKSGKIWGHTSQLFSRNNVELHRLVGKKGGKSSTHKHNSKWSMLFVESGKLKVVVEKNDYELIDSTTLLPGEYITIPPGEYHFFEVLDEDTVVYEIYWAELDPGDIERRDCGSLTVSRH